MIEDKKVWGIHTLDHELFMRENVIATGWKEMGDLSELNDRTAMSGFDDFLSIFVGWTGA